MPAANDADDFDARLKSVRDAEDGFQKLAPDDATVKSAGHDCGILVSSLAEPSLRYQSVSRRLGRAPASAEDVRTAVADKVNQDLVKYRAVAPPNIPFVKFPQFQPGFHPVAAADYLSGLKPLIDTASMAAAPAPAAGECAAATVLNAADLGAAGTRCRAAIDEYIRGYSDYWYQFIPDPTPGFRAPQAAGGSPKNLDWQALRQKLPIGAGNVDNDLDQWSATLLAISQSVLPLKAYASPGDITRLQRLAEEAQNADANLKRVTDKPFADTLRLWKDLGDDPVAARTTLLNMSAGTFAEQYMLVNLDGTDYITHYWRAMTIALLQSLIDAPDPTAQQIADFLGKTRGFPVGPVEKELTQQDIDALRLLVQSVLLPSLKSTGKPGDPILAGGTLVGGDPARVNMINQQMRNLARGSLAQPEQDRIRKLTKFLDSLPSGTDQWSCTISIPDNKKQQELIDKYSQKSTVKGVIQTPPKASSHWQEIRLELAQTPASPRVRTDAANKLAEVPYPGPPIRLAVYTYPSDPDDKPDQYISPPGAAAGDHWECLKFLTGNCHLVADDPDRTSQYVELSPTFKGVKYSLWVVLKFKKPLPDYQEWPK
jgi:hypothetical protein